MMNKIEIMGRLTRVPELRSTTSDRSMCRGFGWNPAEDERRKDYIAMHG